MSAEALIRRGKQPDIFREEIATLRRVEQSGSPINILSKRLIRAGREGLREASSQFDLEYADADETRDVLYATNKTDVAAVILGASMIELERAIVDGEFSHENYIAIINGGFVGTLFPDFISRKSPDTEKIEKSKRWKMVRRAEQDKTLTSFFSKNSSYWLPQAMFDFLYRGKHLVPVIEILPAYKALAELVIENK